MKLLGAILAGAAGDAEPPVAIDGVAAALAGQCAGVIAVGRHWPPLPFFVERPGAGLGVLGGLAGALAAAAEGGFDAVLTTGPAKTPPADLARRLGLPNAVVAGQHCWGIWTAGLAGPLASYLTAGGDRTLAAWTFAVQARQVSLKA